jgi:hypothetical protein
MRFFFDFASEDKVILDYLGYEFKSSQTAIEFAQENLLVLKNSLNRDWVGWSINVCNAEGRKLCSLPVEAAEDIAAQADCAPLCA